MPKLDFGYLFFNQKIMMLSSIAINSAYRQEQFSKNLGKILEISRFLKVLILVNSIIL